MDAAIRWSPHSGPQDARFMIISVVSSRLRLCRITEIKKNKVEYAQIALRDQLPQFTAFDWSKTQERFVGIGTASGEAVLLELDPDDRGPEGASTQSFPIKRQRKCNSIAFSAKNFLATGLDGVRNDTCMNIYDLNSARNSEPYRKLGTSEAITSIKFFANQPDTLVAGVQRQCIRLYDLRDSPSSSSAQFPTRQVHNISIDPLDENYFISAGPGSDATVSMWDRRWVSRSAPGTPSGESPVGAVLEMRSAIDTSYPTHQGNIWSLRFSGTKRGCFGILSNTGEIKIVETAQHTVNTSSFLHANPVNRQGGASWNSNHYTKRSHILQYPWYDVNGSDDMNKQYAAYDFMSTGSPVGGHCMVAMYPSRGQQSRDVGLLRLPETPPLINITATNEIFRNTTSIAKPRPRRKRIAEDLAELQLGTSIAQDDSIYSQKMSNSMMSTETISTGITEQNLADSSMSTHEELLRLRFPKVKLAIEDLLTTLDAQKRRCLEGYLFDCRKNQAITANDPWLVGLWDLIQRLDDLRADDGMIVKGLDMSYFGVYSIWSNTLKKKPPVNRLIGVEPPNDNTFFNAIQLIAQLKELPQVHGISTKYHEHRQLGLAICGWDHGLETLRERSILLIDQGYAYKAIVLAVFKGHKQLAMELLQRATKKRIIQNLGLGAIIAGSAFTEDQKPMFEWMLEEAEDPYLRALLTHFTHRSYLRVAEMTSLALADRVGIALRYLDDATAKKFIDTATSAAITAGNLEGIVLTGLDQPSLSLFQNYITRTSDLQTAVLALARAQPLYTTNTDKDTDTDPRWDLWYETYLTQMHTWHAFMPRSKFISQHNLKAVNHKGKSTVKPPAPQVTIRCNNCQLSLARHSSRAPAPSSSASTSTSNNPPLISPTSTAPPEKKSPSHHHHNHRSSPAAAAGTICPRCAAPMPRCGICMMWLGTPDPAKAGVANALAEEDLLARQMTLCLACGHGFHGHHAREWFRRHQMCPVPDCGCVCGLGVGGR